MLAEQNIELSALAERGLFNWNFTGLGAKVTGQVRKYFNEFITMPKGRLTVEVLGRSQFHIDPNLAQKNSVVVNEDSVPELG